jgi:hypothetical protein
MFEFVTVLYRTYELNHNVFFTILPSPPVSIHGNWKLQIHHNLIPLPIKKGPVNEVFTGPLVSSYLNNSLF